MLKRCSRGGVSIWAWGKRLRAMMCRGSVLSGRSLPRNLDLSTCALALHSWRTLVGPRADRPTAKTRSRPLAPRPPQEILPETQAGFTGNPGRVYRKPGKVLPEILFFQVSRTGGRPGPQERFTGKPKQIYRRKTFTANFSCCVRRAPQQILGWCFRPGIFDFSDCPRL